MFTAADIDDRVDDLVTEGVVFTLVETDNSVDDLVTKGVLFTVVETDDRVDDIDSEGVDVEDGVNVSDIVVETDSPVVKVALPKLSM